MPLPLVVECRTSPAVPIVFQFDDALIEDGNRKLQPSTLTVDNLTVDWLRSRLQELEASIREAQDKQTKLATDPAGGGGGGTGTKPTTPILKVAALNGSSSPTNGLGGKETNA